MNDLLNIYLPIFVILLVVYDGYEVLIKNKVLGKLNSLWYVGIAIIYFVGLIMDYLNK